MANGTESETAYENPLIPNAKLRQIYAAMVRARMVSERLAARAKRGGGTGARGLEACLVSTSVDLGPHDLVSDTLDGGAMEFLRGATAERVLRPEERARKRGLRADCGAAARLPGAPGIQERMWAALGAAAALKAETAQEKVDAELEARRQAGVAVVYARGGEVSTALWRKVLAFAATEELPVLFVVLPALREARGAKAGGTSAIALQHGIPGMAVDADDAVAIYRVAQEAIGRARIGGGAALIECVPFVIEGAKGRRGARADAIVGLEQYMLGRGVVKKSWMEREATSFAKRMAR
jgi:TPP-dependent pyruvate/acetoin dehydrogenase alpha subunit